MQGVSINLFIKTNKKRKNQLAEVYHYDLYGKREAKYEFLSEHSLDNIPFNSIKCEKDNYFFAPKDFTNKNTYDKGFKVNNLFLSYKAGVATGKDAEYVKHNKKEFNLMSEKIISYDYRPFDIRKVLYDTKTIQRARYDIMKHMLQENIGFLTCKKQTTFDFQHVFLTKNICDRCLVSLSTGEVGYLFPLYLYEDLDNSRHPNFDSTIIKKFADGLKLKFTEEKTDEKDTFAPIDVLDYIYAVLHSPKYRETYKEFLKIDFPKIPYPKDKSKFWKLVALGAQIREIHLLESDKLNTLTIGYPVSGDNIVTKLSYTDDKVFINDTQYFDKVPEVAWNFYIGGYQPAQKWLKDRKGKELTFDDICHYQKIINALYLTDNLMQEIDVIGVI